MAYGFFCGFFDADCMYSADSGFEKWFSAAATQWHAVADCDRIILTFHCSGGNHKRDKAHVFSLNNGSSYMRFDSMRETLKRDYLFIDSPFLH